MTVRVRISLPPFLVIITVAVCLWAAAASSPVQAQTNDPPIFSSTVFTRTVAENSPAGTLVGAPVTASDPGQALTYTLGGTDASSFTVDSDTGQLRVGSGTALDYETKTSYSLTVTATDPSNLTDTADVTINVVDLDEVGGLGTIEFVTGCTGNDCGYVQGSYGTLSSGDFPEEIFDSGSDRTVLEFREDADGFWYLRYQGGTAYDWLSDDDDLNTILVVVTYEDGKDSREFVLGGFLSERQSDNRLKVDPPIPSTDFATRSGETVTVDFVRHIGDPQPDVVQQVTPPNPRPDSMVEFIAETTPGGPVVAQSLIVLLVYAVWMWKGQHSTYSLILAGLILVLTPWVPVVFGLGTVTAAVINFVNILLGAYCYKYYFEAREQYS